jgi:uncharacterized protein YoxC
MTTINSQDDFLRALSENPEWKAAVRAQILGEELLQLPARFNAFIEQMTAFVVEQKEINARIAARLDSLESHVGSLTSHVGSLTSHVGSLTSHVGSLTSHVGSLTSNVGSLTNNVGSLTSSVDSLTTSVASLNNNVARLTDDSGWLRGFVTREAAIRDAGVIALEMGLEYVRTVTKEELYRFALKAAQGEALSNELRSFRHADLVIEATDGVVNLYIAVEASFIGGAYDVARALRNAAMLTEYTGLPAKAAIASVRNHHEIERQLTSERQPTSGAVYWHEIEERALRSD